MRKYDLGGYRDEVLSGGRESVGEDEVGGLVEEGEVSAKEGGNRFDV